MEKSKIDALIKAFESNASSEAAESVPLELLSDSDSPEEEDTEMKFSLSNHYTKKLFLALARKHGYKSYRYPRQKRTTVILKGKRSFFDQVLWPQFLGLSEDLNLLLDQVTNEAILAVLREDPSDSEDSTPAN
jgi:hypothetical protein